ncbi:MAG: four helix bundle protein [Candidatus Omnitrophica bacterium]|nr:four helix bundle protein [Candidatus Omnitrophota bacterium]
MKLVKVVYEITKNLPIKEKYGLSSQMRRAVIFIPCNIAEGAARCGKRESMQFYKIARGSLSELDTQLELCKMLKLLALSDIILLTKHLEIVDSLLSGLIRSRKNRF